MIKRIERKVTTQPLGKLRGIPRAPKQAIHISPSHCKGVVYTKNRIKAPGFKLALTGDASPASFKHLVT